MPFALNDGARIHWDSTGSGTPVLLIMGHLYSADRWGPLIETLEKTHRVIAFDNRGVGRSDTTSGVTIEQMASDALAVLTAAGEPAAHVYGVSMGGGIAAEFGMAWPDRTLSLTLGCTLLKTQATPRSRPVRLRYRLPHWLARRAFLSTATPASFGSAAPAEAVARSIAAGARTRFTVKGLREQNKAVARYATSVERAQDRLQMPVLVLHGDEDTTVPVELGRLLHQSLPGSRYVEFAGAGHNYVVATGGQANAVFIDFIDRVDADRSA